MFGLQVNGGGGTSCSTMLRDHDDAERGYGGHVKAAGTNRPSCPHWSPILRDCGGRGASGLAVRRRIRHGFTGSLGCIGGVHISRPSRKGAHRWGPGGPMNRGRLDGPV